MLNNLLLYRLVVVNGSAAALLVWAWMQGYVETVVYGDTSRITYAIIALFAIGMWSIALRSWKVSKAFNAIKRGDVADLSPVKFIAKGDHIDDISMWLVTLGLIGTVVGFIMAIGALDTGALATAQGVQQSISQMMGGMKVAIYTTLVGSVLGLWLDVNRRILKTATICMIEDNEEMEIPV